MSSEPPELGKGLFGYRKSAVNQILADRDLMLRQAEGRVRQAESKVGELERELGTMRDRNNRMDEQLERLRNQLDVLAKRTDLLSATPEPDWHESAPSSEPDGDAVEGEPEPVAGFAEATIEQPSAEEEDLSYGFELTPPQAAPEEYTGYEAEAVSADAEGYDASAGQGDSYWGGADQQPEVHMETGPEYADPAATSAGGEQEGDLGFETTEVPQANEFSYGGAQAISRSEEYQEEMDSLSYGAELPSSYQEPEAEPHQEPEAMTFEEPEAMTFEPVAEPYQEPEPMTFEPVAEPAEYEPGGYETPEYESATSQQDIGEEEASVEATRPQPSRPSASSEASETSSRFVTEEIAGVLSAAEESASRILERARIQSDQQIAKSTRLWEEVRAEVGRLASWREGIEPIIQTVVTKVDGIRTQIEDVPERIRDALAPMADSISGIDGDLAELGEACSPPLLLTPSELEPEEAEASSDWGGSEGDEPSGHRNAG